MDFDSAGDLLAAEIDGVDAVLGERLVGRVGVRPLLDPAVLAGSDGEGTGVGLAGALAVDSLRCARGCCSPGISPLDL